MNDPLRGEIFRLMERILELRPEYRVGQLICNAAMFAEGQHEPSVGNIDDEVLVAALKRYLDGIERHFARAHSRSHADLVPA